MSSSLCPAPPSPSSVNLVIYHGHCTDGFGAAFAAWKLLGSENVEYHGTQHGQPPPDVSGKHVAIVDFSYKRPVLLELMTKASSLIVLDHHKSAERDLEGLTENCVFDMTRSGATISWSYFHRTEPPMMLRYIQDKDIWTWLLPGSREFSAAFEIVPMTFEAYDAHLDKIDELIREGEVLRRFISYKCELLARDAEPRVLAKTGHKVMVLNTQSFISEVGNVIASTRECDFSLSYFYDFEYKKNRVSLRASQTSTVDLSVVSAQFGGGGHAKAAGFEFEGNIEDLFSEKK
jgi:oligoribonuclease NrnB/cAMP/cGMP phosphodiesterase (DHH superfamily)